MLRLILVFVAGFILAIVIAYLWTWRGPENDSVSLWQKIFGRRSLLSAVVGSFFADKNNAASVIAIVLVVTLCFVVAYQHQYDYVNGLLNIVFVVIGYYFGSKRDEAKDDDDGPPLSSANSGTPPMP